MRPKIVATVSALALFLLGIFAGRGKVNAQASNPFQFTVNASHTSCSATIGATTYCFASDGLYVSLAGGSFALVNAPGGVASFNGRTGAVTPQTGDYAYSQISGTPVVVPPPVTSVNGKTGAVILTATTSVQ